MSACGRGRMPAGRYGAGPNARWSARRALCLLVGGAECPLSGPRLGLCLLLGPPPLAFPREPAPGPGKGGLLVGPSSAS